MTSVSLHRAIAVTHQFSAQIITYDSPAFQEACQLQAQRYTRACSPAPDAFQRYLQIVDATPSEAIPLVVRRHGLPLPGLVVATARLELPSATTIEAIMRFQPDSPSASVLAGGTFAEIGGFATREDLSWSDVLDVLDEIASAVVELAKEHGIEWLWVFPRFAMMGLVLAQIPEVLPPYRFTASPDIAGWNEESALLQQIRELRMKDLPVSPQTPPTLYQITPAQLAEDLSRRLALQAQRRERQDLPALLRTSMRKARQQMESLLYAPQGEIKNAPTQK